MQALSQLFLKYFFIYLDMKKEKIIIIGLPSLGKQAATEIFNMRDKPANIKSLCNYYATKWGIHTNT